MTRWRQRVKWRLEVLAYDGVCLLLKPFSFAQVSAFGGRILRWIGPLTRKNQIVRTGLKTAFPELSPKALDALVTAQWDNTGRTFAEFPLMHRVRVFDTPSQVNVSQVIVSRVTVSQGTVSRVTVSGLDILKANAPAIIVTGHFANWEVMAAVLTQSGLPMRITYRKINNPYMDARIRKQREKYGTKFLVQKSTHKGGRELFEALKAGASIALLNDQKFNEGLSVPFFGVDAMTAPGATRFALKTGRPLLPISIVRNKSNFEVRIHDPIPLEDTGNRERDVRAGVEKIVRFTEDIIRANPDQWFWVHRRWPKPHYKSESD